VLLGVAVLATGFFAGSHRRRKGCVKL